MVPSANDPDGVVDAAEFVPVDQAIRRLSRLEFGPMRDPVVAYLRGEENAAGLWLWRISVADDELAALHADGFGRSPHNADGEGRLARHSLGWVVARDGDRLAGAAQAGCEWLHADWEGDLDRFSTGTCGFTPTSAGLHLLREQVARSVRERRQP